LCFGFVQKSPPGFFETGSGAFPAAPSLRAFAAKTHWEKAPEHCLQVKRTLISTFGKSRVYLDYSISTDKIGRIRLAESSLQIQCTGVIGSTNHKIISIDNRRSTIDRNSP